MTAPSLTAVGGFATENGSWGVFGGHRGVWKEDRIRYLAGLGYASLQLTFYGTSPQTSDISRDFEIRTVPFIQDIGVWNAGGGFRYLTAREFGLQMGIDVARGPEQWAIYVVFGNSWN